MKIKYCSIILILIFIIPLFAGCNNNRPDFLLPNNTEQNSPSSPETANNVFINYESGITIKSSNLISNNNNCAVVKKNTKIKIEFENLEKITSIENKNFYFDKNNKVLISGITINDLFFSVSDLSNYILIENDSNISIIKSKVSLNSLMLAQKFEESNSPIYETHEKFYKKFNYISNNFRHSLLSFENNKIDFDLSQPLYYVDFKSNNHSIENIKNINGDIINLKLYNYYETCEISLCFIYSDEVNNIFISEVIKINDLNKDKHNLIIYDQTYNLISITLNKKT